jgi:hypothetical protein
MKVCRVGDAMFAALPEPLVRSILSGHVKPGKIVVIASLEHQSATRDELKQNWILVLPLCQQYPKHNPSNFLIADILIILDKILQKRLLKGSTDMEKHDAAIAEGKSLKRCISKAREILRTSGYSEASHSPEIAAIKAALKRKSSASEHSPPSVVLSPTLSPLSTFDSDACAAADSSPDVPLTSPAMAFRATF